MPRKRQPASPFRYFNSSPEVIRLVVMMYVKYPLSLRNVEDLLFERGIDICHETVRMWWNRFGPLFAGDIRRQRVSAMRGFRQWPLASRRDVRQAEQRDGLLVACGRPGRRDPRKLHHEDGSHSKRSLRQSMTSCD